MNSRKESVKNLLARGYSQSEAARMSGVSRQTVINWLKDEDFIESLRLEQQEIARDAIKQRLCLEEEASENRRKIEALESNSSPDFLRERELHLLNRLQGYAERDASEGSLRAIGMILKISERRCKLLGIDRQIAPIIKAVETLLNEGMLYQRQVQIISDGIHSLEDALRIEESNYRLEEVENAEGRGFD